MKKLKYLPVIVMLAASGTLYSASVLADGLGSPDNGQPPVERQRGGPDMPHHFAYKGHDFERGKPVPEDFRGRDCRVDDWQDKGLPHRLTLSTGRMLMVTTF